MTLSTALTAIRDRLARATPGKWINAYPNAGKLTPMKDHVWTEHKDLIARGLLPKDATLIAHAPQDLTRLLAALEIADAAFEKIHHAVANACEWHGADPHDSELDSFSQVENWHEGAFEAMRVARAEILRVMTEGAE